MKKTFFYLIIILFFTNCKGTINTTRFDYPKDLEIKKAYVISGENSQYVKFKFGIIMPYGYMPLPDDPAVETEKIGNTDLVIKEELEKYGISAVIGKKGDTPDDFDIIVEYRDTWRWDFKKILEGLEIIFISNDGKEILSKSEFAIGSKEFHNYPSPEKEVPKMIEEMLAQ